MTYPLFDIAIVTRSYIMSLESLNNMNWQLETEYARYRKTIKIPIILTSSPSIIYRTFKIAQNSMPVQGVIRS